MQVRGDFPAFALLGQYQLGREAPEFFLVRKYFLLPQLAFFDLGLQREVEFFQLRRALFHAPLQVIVGGQQRLRREFTLEINPEHVGQGIDQVALLGEERAFRLFRHFFKVIDFYAPGQFRAYAEITCLQPACAREAGIAAFAVSDNYASRGDLRVLPGRGNKPDDAVKHLSGGKAVVLQHADR